MAGNNVDEAESWRSVRRTKELSSVASIRSTEGTFELLQLLKT